MPNLIDNIAVPDLVDRIANSLSDLAILALSAIAFGLVGGLVALLSNRLWFRRWTQHSAYEDAHPLVLEAGEASAKRKHVATDDLRIEDRRAELGELRLDEARGVL